MAKLRLGRIAVEIVEVCAVLGVSALMWFYGVQDPWLLHLYYLPVVVCGFCLGRRQARLLALLSVLTGAIVFVPNLDQSVSAGIPLLTALSFGLWGTVLITVADVVGLLSDRWKKALCELNDAHQKDVLTDGLTGVASRRALEFELARKLADWNRRQAPVGLLLVDIDHFKGFNDRYGHDVGDAVLRQTAEVLVKAVRETDLVARFGGEEFAILLVDSSEENSTDIAERARRMVEKNRFVHKGLRLRLTVSVGFAQASGNDSLAAFIQRADAALYASKAAGRNCVHHHDGQGCRMAGSIAPPSSRYESAPKAVGRQEESHRDVVTGLPGRAVFIDELRRRTAEVHRYGGTLTTALVRANDFARAINDDANAVNCLLATIGRLATSELRDTDLVARYDEDALAVLLPSTPLSGAWTPLRRLADRAASHSDPKYPMVSYGVCVGAAQLLGGEETTDLLRRMEAALALAADGENSPQPDLDDAASLCSLCCVVETTNS